MPRVGSQGQLRFYRLRLVGEEREPRAQREGWRAVSALPAVADDEDLACVAVEHRCRLLACAIGLWRHVLPDEQEGVAILVAATIGPEKVVSVSRYDPRALEEGDRAVEDPLAQLSRTERAASVTEGSQRHISPSTDHGWSSRRARGQL